MQRAHALVKDSGGAARDPLSLFAESLPHSVTTTTGAGDGETAMHHDVTPLQRAFDARANEMNVPVQSNVSCVVSVCAIVVF